MQTARAKKKKRFKEENTKKTGEKLRRLVNVRKIMKERELQDKEEKSE